MDLSAPAAGQCRILALAQLFCGASAASAILPGARVGDPRNRTAAILVESGLGIKVRCEGGKQGIPLEVGQILRVDDALAAPGLHGGAQDFIGPAGDAPGFLLGFGSVGGMD